MGTLSRWFGTQPLVSVSKLAVGGLIVALAGASVATHRQVHAKRADFPRDADVLYLPPAKHLGPMSLGYREALADLIWIRAVIFTGDTRGAGMHDWILTYLEAIYTLAPTFQKPYAWGGVAFIYTGTASVDRDMVDRSMEVYRRGLAYFPEDHELLFALGMLLTRDVQTVPGYDEVERELAMEEGTMLIRKAAAFGASPLVRQLAATLITEGGTDQLAIQFLEAQLLQAQDEDHRRLLQQKLEAAIGEAGFESIDKLRAEFSADHQKAFPYLPADVYALIRE